MPTATVSSSLRLPFEDMALSPDSATYQQSIERLQALPYRARPYCQRNWGHEFHSLCSYPSKIKPAIAYFLIRLFTQQGETVFDPFCGVGTIPFESCQQGRVGIGSDLNPLAYFVTHAKVRPPSEQSVNALLQEMESRMSSFVGNVESVEEEIRPFFHPDTLSELCRVRRLLLEASHSGERERRSAACFLLACLAHILHGNRPYALSRRSHNIIPIPPKGEFRYKPVLAGLQTKAQRALREPLATSFCAGQAYRASVFGVSELVGYVDNVITSPPFLGSTHFVRQNRVRLWLCGWDYATQEKMKEEFLEHQNALTIYRSIFDELAKVVKPDGKCILHLGVVKQTDMGQAIRPDAEAAGFECVGIVYEDTRQLENHGRTDRGGTHHHQFLCLRRR